MKKKILKIGIVFGLVIMFLTGSVLSAAIVTKKDADFPNIKTNNGGDPQIRSLTPPYSGYDDYMMDLEGDPYLDSQSSPSGASVTVKSIIEDYNPFSELKERGKSGFDLSEEWIALDNLDSVTFRIDIKFDWSMKLWSSWGSQGDSAHASVILIFYVKEKETGDYLGIKSRTVQEATQNGGIGFNTSQTDVSFYDFIGDKQVTKGNTYVIGFIAEAYASVVLRTGYVESIVTITHDTSKHDAEIQVQWPNRNPATPSTPAGPKKVDVITDKDGSVTCTYTTSSTDSDGDQIYYEWRYLPGYGQNPITGPFNSGEPGKIKHTWTRDDIASYDVQVRAIDDHGGYSDWSDSLPVEVPRSRNKNYNMLPFAQLFEKFPMLKQLLQQTILFKMF